MSLIDEAGSQGDLVLLVNPVLEPQQCNSSMPFPTSVHFHCFQGTDSNIWKIFLTKMYIRNYNIRFLYLYKGGGMVVI